MSLPYKSSYLLFNHIIFKYGVLFDIINLGDDMRRILVMDFDIYINESYSLKDKRRIRNMIIDKLKNRFNISIIESDNQDKWNLLSLTISYVGLDNFSVLKYEKTINLFIDSNIESFGYISNYQYEIY